MSFLKTSNYQSDFVPKLKKGYMPILNLEWFLQHCSVSVPHIFLIPFLQMNAANKTPSTSWNSLHSEPIQRILCGYGQISLASHFTSTFPRLYNIMCICRDGSMRRQKLLEIRFDLNGQTTNGAPTHCVISNKTKSFEAIVWVGYSLADNLYRGTYSDVMIQLNKPSDCMCPCVCVCAYRYLPRHARHHANVSPFVRCVKSDIHSNWRSK